jgi:1-acyl-sn-glycerol-3-phosphate acyltransferase
VLKIAWLPITYIGREHIPHEPVIFVVNHQSSFDVPLIGYLMNKKPHVWLALAILRNSLMLRFVLPKVSILVDMSSPASGLRTLRQAISFVSENPANVIIFPEGGRFTDNTIHPFVSGFALISRKAGRPVVPVLIKGVNKVYPPGSFMVYSHPIVVTVGPVMRVTEQETDDAFKDRVYQWFVTHNQESA